MKVLSILTIVFLTVIVACTNNGGDKNFTGTFSNESKSEYSQAFDTLKITRLKETENSYNVERRTGYQKIRNGVIQPMEYKSESWQSSWNDQNKVLSETEYGRQITPANDGNSITLKNTKYQRIR